MLDQHALKEKQNFPKYKFNLLYLRFSQRAYFLLVIMIGSVFNPENGGDMFLRNTGLFSNYRCYNPYSLSFNLLQNHNIIYLLYANLFP
jgi:hypothetical protein